MMISFRLLLFVSHVWKQSRLKHRILLFNSPQLLPRVVLQEKILPVIQAEVSTFGLACDDSVMHDSQAGSLQGCPWTSKNHGCHSSRSIFPTWPCRNGLQIHPPQTDREACDGVIFGCPQASIVGKNILKSKRLSLLWLPLVPCQKMHPNENQLTHPDVLVRATDSLHGSLDRRNLGNRLSMKPSIVQGPFKHQETRFIKIISHRCDLSYITLHCSIVALNNSHCAAQLHQNWHLP